MDKLTPEQKALVQELLIMTETIESYCGFNREEWDRYNEIKEILGLGD